MKQDKFENAFNRMIKECTNKPHFDGTNEEMDDAYETYLDLVKQIEDGTNEFGVEQMVRMTQMSIQERLRWRTIMSEEGIELTPTQVDQYIVILQMALSHS